ncbi:MAG: WD40-repeat-containing domain protein [Monoraphidium minutum]|nr:MAG: WD40-repeat-containing domain protein [Monoraphidium minutum]
MEHAGPRGKQAGARRQERAIGQLRRAAHAYGMAYQASVVALLPRILSLLPVASGDLCRATSACKHFYDLNTSRDVSEAWRAAFLSRWRMRAAGGGPGRLPSWRALYARKMAQARSWSGKYHSDALYGHQGGIKCLQLLPEHSLLATGARYTLCAAARPPPVAGSLDRTVRLWDLRDGVPVSASRPHGGTVRAVALDDAALVSGGSDHVVRLWEAGGGGGSSSGDDERMDELECGGGGGGGGGALFDLASGPGRLLAGHIGPITSLSLSAAALYSGSWDTSVRVWRRADDWACAAVLRYPDWVLDVAARGGLLLVAAAREVHVHDRETHGLLHKLEDPHDGAVSCIDAPEHGSLVFTGGADGLVIGHDLRMRSDTSSAIVWCARPPRRAVGALWPLPDLAVNGPRASAPAPTTHASSAIVWHHNAPVNSLAFEEPWLASASSDGMVLMTHAEAAQPTYGGRPKRAAGGGSGGGGGGAAAGRAFSPSTRRNLPVAGGEPVFAVDIAGMYLAAGGRRDAVSVWDFTGAEAAAGRAAAAKAARNSRRRRSRGARGGGGGGGGGGAGSPPGAGLAAAAAAAAAPPQQQQQGNAQARSAPQRVPQPPPHARAAARLHGSGGGGDGGGFEGGAAAGGPSQGGAAGGSPDAPRRSPGAGGWSPAARLLEQHMRALAAAARGAGGLGGSPSGPWGGGPGSWPGGGGGGGGPASWAARSPPARGRGAGPRPPPPAPSLVAPPPTAAAAAAAQGQAGAVAALRRGARNGAGRCARARE